MIGIFSIILAQVFTIQITVSESRQNKYTIAESSYLSNDYFRAEQYFKSLLEADKFDNFTYLAIERLFNIAEKVDDSKLFADTNIFLKKIDKKKSSNFSFDSLNYTLGRIFFHRGKYREAYQYLKDVDKNSGSYPKALYLIAASSAVLGKNKPALILFDRISTMDGISSQLKDVSILAKARILMLLERYDEALVEYQRISTYSPFYIESVKETVWVFMKKRNYPLALTLLESLSFVNMEMYLEEEDLFSDDTDSLTNFDLMSLKNIQGDIYLQNLRFDDALNSFNEVLGKYNKTKETFKEELGKLKFSSDLTKITSHRINNGKPRLLTTSFRSNMFYSNELYSVILRNWTTQEEKIKLEKAFTLYFSLLTEVERINMSKEKTTDGMRLASQLVVLNKLLKNYLSSIIKFVYVRLDEIGLKAQLGIVDLVYKIKDDQTSKIIDIQTKKQDFSDAIDEKFKGLVK